MMIHMLGMNTMQIVVVVCAGLVLLAVLALSPFLMLYTQAMFSGAKVDFLHLVGMKLRKTDARTVVFCYIRAVRAGLKISVSHIEAHHIAGGHVPSVVNALIACDLNGIDLSWDEACAIDLGGIDVQEVANRVVKAKAAGLDVDFDSVMQEMAASGDPAFHKRVARQ